MKQVTLHIPDKKMPLFIELAKSLSFVKKIEVEEVEEYKESTKEEILEGIRQAVKEVNLIKQGKLKGKPLKELLDEL